MIFKQITKFLKHRLFIGAFIILGQTLFSQNTTALNETLNSLVQHPDFSPALVGVHIVSIDNNKEILSYNAHKKLTPASITKLITTHNAFYFLTPEFKFKTTISILGERKDSIFSGTIKITGSGDPTLESRFFKSRKNILSNAVIDFFKYEKLNTIIGNIQVDYSIFDFPSTPSTWLWSDIGNYYGASPCGLNYKDNSITVFLQSDNQKVSVLKTEPSEIPYVLVNQLTVKNFKKDSAYAYCCPFSDTILLSGAIPKNRSSFKIKIANPKPFNLFKEDLKKQFKENNISFSYLPTNYLLVTKKDVFSPPLSKIVAVTNLYSNNLYAESLNFYLGYKKFGKGNFLTGIKAQMQLMKKQNLPVDEVSLFDGSGLSPMNAVTPYFFTQLLVKSYKSDFKNEYLKSLPKAGISGTLRNFGKNTILENNLQAKSGYMEGVRSYAGYFTGKSGQKYAFCIIVNHYNGSPYEAKKAIESFLVKACNDL